MSACSAGVAPPAEAPGVSSAEQEDPAPLVSADPDPPVAVDPAPLSPLSPLSDRITSLGSALGVPDRDTGPIPLTISIDRLGIDAAPIAPVGVVANGDMEIPGADEVGWYEYGASPGAPGSAVLAAHVAFDGQDGVFRYLTDLEPGDEFRVGYDDGSSADFRVASSRQYDKAELPFDAIFAKDGIPSVALITCGGSFNRTLSSYDDNVVVYGVPI